MTHDKEAWEREFMEAEKVWNDAVEELNTFGEMHMALPLLNAICAGVVVQARDLRSAADLLIIAGEPKEEVTKFIQDSLSNLHGIIFYSGYLLGKRGIELEKIPCMHESGREN